MPPPDRGRMQGRRVRAALIIHVSRINSHQVLHEIT